MNWFSSSLMLLGFFVVLTSTAHGQTRISPKARQAVPTVAVTVINQCSRSVTLRFGEERLAVGARESVAVKALSLSELNPFGVKDGGAKTAASAGGAKGNMKVRKVSESNPFAFTAVTPGGQTARVAVEAGQSYGVTVSRCTSNSTSIAFKNLKTNQIDTLNLRTGSTEGTLGLSL